MEKLVLQEEMTLDVQKQAIQVAFMQGFQSLSAEFPICTIGNQTNAPNLFQHYQELKVKSGSTLESVNQYAQKSIDFDWRRHKGLEAFFTEGYLLEDTNHDFLADQLNLKLALDQAVDVWQLSALCQLMFRFGMETTAYSGDLFACPEEKGNRLLVKKDSSCGLSVTENHGHLLITLKGSGQALVDFASHFCQAFPDEQDDSLLITTLQEMTKSFALQNSDGQQLYLAATEQATDAQPFLQYIEPVKVFEKEYPLHWEVTEFKRLLQENVYPKLSPGDHVSIQGIISEGPEQRQELIDEIRKDLAKKEVELKKIEIVSAYKQGFSWITEYALPELQQLVELDRIEISFKPFLPEGQQVWLDEDGATPTYHSIGANNDEHWYDLPIRFLQELYPVDDSLAAQLAIAREDIHFIADDEQTTTYVIKAFSQGKEVYRNAYQAAYAERAYIDEFPELGKTHPATGHLCVTINQKRVLDCRIKTDLEQIWDIYQEELLPTFGSLLDQKTGGNSDACYEPLFSKIVLEATVSEPEFQLDSRQDMISSLNSFHEDLYFVGLDYFKKYGMTKWNRLLDAPGLLLPQLKVGKGAPCFKCTVYDQEDHQPFIWQDEVKQYAAVSKEELALTITAVNYDYEKKLFDLDLHVTGIDDKYVAHYAKLIETGQLTVTQHLQHFGTITFNTNTGSFSALLPAIASDEQVSSITDIDLMETEVIGYTDYQSIIEKLKHVPELRVSQIGTSYQGREIYGIELASKKPGYISRVKRLTNKPSLIINARHHANEVSGTNGALLLIKELLVNPKYAHLSEQLNLMIVPMENVDGAHIHYQLQQDNPYWKLHVARFNAVGKEFYNEYFNFDTIYPEALAFTRIWHQLLPDIVVDNHGVPSHEWDQQFSGYTSPSYKGFWLPRSLLYGYFWTVKDTQFKVNRQLNQALEQEIASAIGANQSMTALNKEWMDRFEKYAHQWLPKLFPAEYYQNMINYWIYFEHDPNHRYPSIRFPWITTVAYTSEVADETAQGDYLKRCAETHVTHDLATIDLLLSSQPRWTETWQVTSESLTLARIRQRPLQTETLP